MPLFAGVVASAIVWAAVLLSFWANPWCSVEFKQQAADRFLSTIHAIVFGALGVSVEVLTEPRCVTTSSWTKLPVLVFLGYLVVDLVSMSVCDIWQRWRPIDKGMIFHHVFILVMFIAGYETDVGLWWASALGINELSTPCVNIFWYLRHTGQKDSKAFTINGLLLLVLFFLCRILYIPVNIFHFWEKGFCQASSNARYQRLAWVMFFGYVVIYALNLMWFQKLVAGALKSCQRKVDGEYVSLDRPSDSSCQNPNAKTTNKGTTID